MAVKFCRRCGCELKSDAKSCEICSLAVRGKANYFLRIFIVLAALIGLNALFSESTDKSTSHPVQQMDVSNDQKSNYVQDTQSAQPELEHEAKITTLTRDEKCVHHAAFVQAVIAKRDAGISPQSTFNSTPLYDVFVDNLKVTEADQKNVTKSMINSIYFGEYFKNFHGQVFDTIYTICIRANIKQFEPLKTGDD